mmetsp:Transcript_34481/g.53836  ORF Transcript_34481/g.53836 Transcript_34481/m.53836 type:complete len:129 (+) Transcript_34481:1018-1404(+)
MYEETAGLNVPAETLDHAETAGCYAEKEEDSLTSDCAASHGSVRAVEVHQELRAMQQSDVEYEKAWLRYGGHGEQAEDPLLSLQIRAPLTQTKLKLDLMDRCSLSHPASWKLGFWNWRLELELLRPAM